MNIIEITKSINSPYADIKTQIERDQTFAKFLNNNEDLNKYNLSSMIPKVTYDDWVVCYYVENDKFYYINEDDVVEVLPVRLLKYNNKFQPITEDGEIVSDDDLYDYQDCFCCGEADDMSCYIYFN